jgi:hypothetical protein
VDPRVGARGLISLDVFDHRLDSLGKVRTAYLSFTKSALQSRHRRFARLGADSLSHDSASVASQRLVVARSN